MEKSDFSFHGRHHRKDRNEVSVAAPQHTKPCVYLKNKGTVFIHRLVAMAKCSASTRSLVQQMRQELERVIPGPPTVCMTEPYQLMECISCEGFMNLAVCLPCGHSVCRSCMDKPSERAKDTITCPRCKDAHGKVPIGFTTTRKPTLLLQNISQKWYPIMLESCRYREDGNRMAQENNLLQALQCYNMAVENGPLDHRVFSNRSKAHLEQGDLISALQDADMCCSLRPYWSKGHYRRGMVLEKMDNFVQAAGSYLLCLHLGGVDQPVLRLIHKVLEKLPQRSLSCTLSSPTPEQQALISQIVQVTSDQFNNFLRLSKERRFSYPIDISTIEIGDFECVLCTGLLFQPVTVPCGHTFCQSCLARTFDHTPYCPICRSPLAETFSQHTLSSGRMCVDVVVESLIKLCFPDEYQERKQSLETELLRKSRIGLCDTEELPIFICTMAYPSMSCPLHIFEPRYRLMIRRCIESNSRRFGMCLAENEDGSLFSDYGTVLFISSLEYTPDGRSLITTMGERRFQILERNSMDGYAVAKIQFIADQLVEGEEQIKSLRSLQESVYQHSMTWLNALPFFSRLLIIQNSCSPPPPIEAVPESCPDGPAWVWWFVNCVPISPQRKMRFLCCTSLRERLIMLRESLPVTEPNIT